MATKEGPGFTVDDAFAYLILRTHRLLRWHFHRRAAKADLDLTQEQFVMLNKLAHRDGCTQGELVSATFNDRANVSRIVSGLKRKGYLTRRDDPEDGRVVRVFITHKGTTVMREIGKRVPATRKKVYNGLSDEDFQALKRICEKIESNILSEAV